MTQSARAYRNPYTRTPGSSTPGPEVTPEEGRKELWGFFWLSVANTMIITVAGVGTWLIIH
ncbi:MAG: hypothetical protein L3K17_03055 [Thermoplasmata archaeon]|nr:hypothetical protein [Thermoplasmata archaeon]